MPIGWKLANSQRADVFARAKAGESHRQLAAHFGVSKSAITGIISRRNAGLAREQLTEAHDIDIACRYAARQSIDSIAADLGKDKAAIRHALHRRGVTVRNPSDARTTRVVQHDALDLLTDEAAYWCGFLFADGSVLAPGNGHNAIVSVGVSMRDRDHLVKLRTFLGSTHAITDTKSYAYGGYVSRPACLFRVTSARLAERLLGLGRYEGPIAPELASSRHFWRGVVDGDGYIGSNGRHAQLQLVGSHRLLSAFSQFLLANGETERRVRPHKSIHVVGAAAGPAVRVIGLLYRDGQPSLDRKALRARGVIMCQGRHSS